jgi:hypothetical protein
MSNDYEHYKTMYKNYFLLGCISEYNNIPPRTKEFDPPEKIYSYKLKCNEGLQFSQEDLYSLDSLSFLIRPILDRRIYLATESMGSIESMFPDTDCITNECLIMYDSKELDELAGKYAIRRIKEDKEK